MFITLKPRDERDVDRASDHRPAAAAARQVEGARVFLQAAQDVTVGGRARARQFQYTLQDANLDELNAWAPKILDKLKSLPELRDVATDQQTAGTTLTLEIDRDTASRFGIQPQLIDDTLYDAFGQRQVAQYFTQVNSYHVILEVLPELQGDVDTLDKIYIKSPTTGEQVPLSAFAQWTTAPVAPLVDQPSGPVPGDHHQLQPRAGRRARPGDRRDPAARMRGLGVPPHRERHLPGQRAGVPGFARHACRC